MYICTLHQSFNDRTCAFFHFCQTVSSVKFPQGQVQWDTPSQMSVLHHMNLILFSGYVKAPFHSPVSADFGLTFIQQKSARFLLNSFVLPFCTWELPEWWTYLFLNPEPSQPTWSKFSLCFLSFSFLLRSLSDSGLTSIADTCVVSSSPHPLFHFDLFMKVSLLTSCTSLIKGFYWLRNHYKPMNPALIYQSTAEMSVWHKMQSVSSADFNCFGFFWSSILNWWSAQRPNAAAIFFIYITDFSKLSFTASGRCATWNILSGLRAECQIMMSTNGLQDRGRKTEAEGER